MSGLSLEKSIEKARRGLRRIQRGDDKTKKFYLAVFSSLTMIVVVGLWFFYLNLTLPQPHTTQEVVRGEPATEESDNSFFRTLGRGAKEIFEDVKNQIVGLKENLSQVKEFTIEGNGQIR